MLTIQNPKTFDWANMSLADCCEGNAMDTHFTFKLYELMEEKMIDSPVWKFLENVAMPSLEIFGEMEYHGVHVSTERLESVGKFLNDRNKDLEDALRKFDFISEEDNLSSNEALKQIFYLREGAMEFYPPDRTKKGEPSCAAATFTLLLTQINEELERRAS